MGKYLFRGIVIVLFPSSIYLGIGENDRMMTEIVSVLLALAISYLFGILVTKLHLPAILGWLVGGMMLGPNGFGIVDNSIISAGWYSVAMDVFECAAGLMIGMTLVPARLRKSGRGIVVTTLTQAIGTFILVTAVFIAVFVFAADIPWYFAPIMGAVALATAPAPVLSVVREYRSKGPLTDTLVPMAALDDVIGVIVFFLVMTGVAAHLSIAMVPWYFLPLVLVVPLFIGVVVGHFSGIVLLHVSSRKKSVLVVSVGILISAAAGYFINVDVLPYPVLSFLLVGIAFSASFSNIVAEKRLEELMRDCSPLLGLSLVFLLFDLGCPMDYHLVIGAGLYTLIYIGSRAFGKYAGAFFGARASGLPKSVQLNLGLTILPHSGMSLVFTGIAVSVLAPYAPGFTSVLQGTIASAAVINEVLAVLLLRAGLKNAGEAGCDEAAKKRPPSEEGGRNTL